VTKIIPFLGKDGKKAKHFKVGDVLEKGHLGKLEYKVFARGNIHILDSKGGIFKKDAEKFEEIIERITDRFNNKNIKEGDGEIVEGCGDNDNLVFTLKKGELEVSLERKSFKIIDRLKEIVKKAKEVI